MLNILEPLEVRHSDTTSVAKHIGQEVYSFANQNLFCLCSGGAIGSFNDQFTLEFVCVVSVDGLFEGSWNEDIAESLQKYHSS